jgi:hypothetical protein
MRIYIWGLISCWEDLTLDALRDWQLSLDEIRYREQFKEKCARSAILGSGEVNVGVREYIFSNLALLAILTDFS